MLIMADKAKKRTSLSVSKKKGIINSGKSPSAGKSSITSFFSNPPPPKLACPLCGQLVPRFRINEHIDLQCEKFQREDTSITSANRSAESPTEIPTQDQTSSQNRCMETKTSPYFKKQSSKQVHRELRSNNVVGTIDLGSLSSQLSKSGFKPPQDTCTMAGDEPHSTAIGKSSGALSSSQKENYEVSVDKEICSLAIIPTSTPSDQSKKISLDGPQAECKDVLEFKESKSKTFSSAVCVAESALPTLTKRKSGEAPVGRKSNLSKKGRYQMSTKLSREDPPIERPGGREDLGVQLTEGSSSGACCIMLNSSEGSEEPREESNTATEAEDEPLESDDGTVTEDRESAATPRLPYYLQNFLTVVEAVLENEDDRVLFNQEDQSVIQSFEKLSDTGQMLYVRLFQRKLKWLQVNKLDYDKISTNLAPVVQELVEKGFLNPEGDLQDLGEVLDLLPAFEVKGLAKTFHLVRSVTHKQQVIEGLLRLSKQRSLFTVASSQNQIGAVMLKRAKQLAGPCVRLCRGPRAVFSRILLLFSVTDTMEEEETAAGGQGQLYTILMVKSGRLAFPDYTVQRSAKLFQDREDLIRYETAMRTLKDVITAMQAGQWEEALELYTTAKSAWQKLSETYDLSGQEELPVFLRCFTLGWTYTRILSRGVEILQRLCRYEEAVEVLRSLLAQSKYCLDSRGRWWDRLALNLQQHLKLPEQAVAAIRCGLSDPLVRTGHQLSLHQRAVRMKESPSFKKYRLQLQDLPTILVKDVPHVTIRGQLFPHEGGTGKSVFLRPADEEGDQNGDSMVMCSVEDLSLAYYRRQGFDQGIHGEGSTFSTLFGLLLWDIIFMQGIPDVFRNPYQTCPLDLFTDCFYENRKEAIERRVQMFEEMSVETLCSMLEEVWSTQEGRMCSLVSWERFSSLQQAQSLVSCLGGAFLGRIVTRMAKDYRHCRAGLPDLVVWNTSDNSYKLVEVKGPSDRLSQKQQIWLDELQKMGADVEVCHVTAIGARGSRLD